MNAPVKPPAGFNAMRWKCDERGCFNEKRRPKIELLADCVPRNMAFTDLDAMTEVNGHFLILEWKGAGVREIGTGQLIALSRLTAVSPRISVVCISGDAETMIVEGRKFISAGRVGPWVKCDFDGLRRKIKSWSDGVGRASRVPFEATKLREFVLNAVKFATSDAEMKERIMKLREWGLLSDDEATDWIAMAGLRHA